MGRGSTWLRPAARRTRCAAASSRHGRAASAPAVAHWPGVVPAGRVVADVALTLDVLPTLLSLAGAPLPEGVLLDGVDLSAMLRGNGTAAADRCSLRRDARRRPAGHGHKGEGGRRNASVSASAIAACPGLWAVRCGAFKGHWVTRNGQRVQPKVAPPLRRRQRPGRGAPAGLHLAAGGPRVGDDRCGGSAASRDAARRAGCGARAQPGGQRAGHALRACCASNMTEAAGRGSGAAAPPPPAGYPPCVHAFPLSTWRTCASLWCRRARRARGRSTRATFGGVAWCRTRCVKSLPQSAARRAAAAGTSA